MYGLFFGTLNGQVHQLLLPSNMETEPSIKTWHTATDPEDGDPVEGTFKSREFNLGDWDTLKQVRRIFTSITGSNVDMTLHYINAEGNSQSVAIFTDEALPEQDNATPNIVTSPRRIRSAQVEITGTDLVLTNVDIEWKQVRVG